MFDNITSKSEWEFPILEESEVTKEHKYIHLFHVSVPLTEATVNVAVVWIQI